MNNISNDWINALKGLDEVFNEINKEPIESVFKCPRCSSIAYSLWSLAGKSFLKCGICGHRSDGVEEKG